jgi:hypothetical protein
VTVNAFSATERSLRWSGDTCLPFGMPEAQRPEPVSLRRGEHGYVSKNRLDGRGQVPV